ncbi:hypothetical protein EsH8_XI_000126 [Colletotrichum jinshuiense]
MMMCGVINYLDAYFKSHQAACVEGRRLVYFFCEADNPNTSTAETVLRGLIWSLLDQDSSLMSHVKPHHYSAGEGSFTDKNAWFVLSDLLTNLLEDPRLNGTVIIIDALDECIGNRHKLIDFIIKSCNQTCVKWAVSSRNWPLIEHQLDKVEQKVDIQLELNEDTISKVVDAYIQHRVNRLAESHPSINKEIWREVEVRLKSRADGTFLWVSLVCHELGRYGTRGGNVLTLLDSYPSGLDLLYGRMLKEAPGSDHDEKICKEILATAAILYRPVNSDEMKAVIELDEHLSPEEWAGILRSCGSFLTIREGIIRFIHQSAREYILDRKKGFDCVFPKGDESLHHQHELIFSRSLGTLSQTLELARRTKHEGSAAGQAVQPNDIIPGSISYFCLFWVDHLQESGQWSNDTNKDSVCSFLVEHLLHWLEVLGHLGEITKGALAIKCLQSISLSLDSYMAKFLVDAERLLSSFGSIIDIDPKQTYGTALAFCPTGNSVREKFWCDRLPFIKDIRGIPERELLLQVLEGHCEYVSAVAFSPNSKTFASCSKNTITLWDTATGVLQKSLDAHEMSVTAIVFSPDGKVLASGSIDGTIRLWDVKLGILKQEVKNFGAIKALGFLHEGKQLVLASDETNTLRHSINLVDTQTRNCKLVREGSGNRLRNAAFSPNGRWAALIFDDDTSTNSSIWLLNIKSPHDYKEILSDYKGSIDNLAFSSDGNTFAATSYEQCPGITWIWLWSTEKRNLIRMFKGKNPIDAIAFSPVGNTLASGSTNHSVELWDTETGKMNGFLPGNGDLVSAVAFSTHGDIVAAGSGDRKVRFWDAPSAPIELQQHRVNSVAFSPDGGTVASASIDTAIRIWDVTNGDCEKTCKGHTGGVMSAIFSPDGNLIASASSDKTIRIWDRVTGTCRRQLAEHTDIVHAVAFSPDGKAIASASKDHTVKFWTTKKDWKAAFLSPLNRSKKSSKTFKGHSKSVNAVSFSSDGRVIASASDDSSVRLWSVEKGWICTLTAKRALFSGVFIDLTLETFGPFRVREMTRIGLYETRERYLNLQKYIEQHV